MYVGRYVRTSVFRAFHSLSYDRSIAPSKVTSSQSTVIPWLTSDPDNEFLG